MGWSTLHIPQPKTPSRNSKSGIAKQSDCYHSLDIYHLIGNSNEPKVVVEGKSFLALIDLGSQVSPITQDLAAQLQLPIHTLATILNIEGMGGQWVPYIWYVEV